MLPLLAKMKTYWRHFFRVATVWPIHFWRLADLCLAAQALASAGLPACNQIQSSLAGLLLLLEPQSS